MSHPHSPAARFSASLWRSHPMAWAVAVALGSVVAPASQAQQAFSPGWFVDRGAAQGAAVQSGRMPNVAPIQFQLGLTGSAQTDTAAALPFQVGPAAYQTGGYMSVLCQLHLQLAFEAAGTLREDIQDQAGAIQHPATQEFFQVAFLAR